MLTYVAARQDHALPGALLLLAYAGGVAAPLVLVAAASEWVTPALRRLAAHLPKIERATSAVLVALAALVLLQIPEAGTPRPPAPTTVAESPGLERLLFFHSEHCPACRAMDAYLPALERACRSPRWTLTKIDVDRAENAAAVAEANVRAVPTVSLRDERGHEVLPLVGYQTEERLREALQHDGRLACADTDVTPPAPPAGDAPACEIGSMC